MNERTPKIPKRWRTPLVVAAVALAHLGVFTLVARFSPPPAAVLPSPFDVFLAGPMLRPPPPPEPAKEVGGGSPAAPSRIHVARNPPPAPPELPAPPTPAPEPTPVIGASSETSPTPGLGQGGEGSGSGTGTGAGTGPGSGTVRFRLISAPTGAQIARLHPTRSGRRESGEARVACRIRLDTRLDQCRVVSETPSGRGFGPAAVSAAALYRFQPPSRDGRPFEGETVLVVTWPEGR